MDIKHEVNQKADNRFFSSLQQLERCFMADESKIEAFCRLIDDRIDCADFRMTVLLRTYYAHRHLIGEAMCRRMKETILNFKYWMDEPGVDSMCYWSENHQILFSSCEYLAGQLFPDEIFTNTNRNGRWHIDRAKERIECWLVQKWQHGFIEWHSNVYYEEDLSPLANLIDFSADPVLVNRAKIITDLFILDMALHSWQGLFAATSGRCYEKTKKNPSKQHTDDLMEFIFEQGQKSSPDETRLSMVFLINKKYDLPPVLKSIAKDRSAQIIKTSMGLDLAEIRNHFEDLSDKKTTGVFLWSMEAFTNPEAISMAMRILKEYHMFDNGFLQELGKIYHPLLLKLGLYPLVSRILNPATNGTAIQRVNSYTYRDEACILSTAVSYHPGEFGYQQHIWQATLSKEVSVFTTHPAGAMFTDEARNSSPSEWVGNGRNPHAVQHGRVMMAIYNLNKRKGLLETPLRDYTHAWFPTDLFDEVIHEGNYLFGRLKDTYIVLIGKTALEQSPKDPREYIQKGKLSFWVCEIGTHAEEGSFSRFVRRIQSNPIRFVKNTLFYETVNHAQKRLALHYNGTFHINGHKQSYQYERIESEYTSVKREPEEFQITHAGHTLSLNYAKGLRTFT